MTVSLEITGRDLKSNANAWRYSTDGGALGSGKVLPEYRKLLKNPMLQNAFNHCPDLSSDMQHTSAGFSYFLVPRKGLWALGKADGQIPSEFQVDINPFRVHGWAAGQWKFSLSF